MKTGVVVSVIVLAVLGGIYWVSTGSSNSSNVVGNDDPLAPSPTGPHPKVVVDEPMYDFGRMVLGGSGKHTFVIKNEGQAELRLGEPEMTCQCTVAEDAPESIPPGGTAEITLAYEPTSATEMFDKGAVIRTNDPENPELRLAILGVVDQSIVMEPTGVWQIGDVSGGDKVSVTGYIFSRVLDDLEVSSWKAKNPALKVETSAMTDEARSARGARSGVKVDVSLDQSIPVGKFEDEFTLTVQAKGQEEPESHTVKIEGTRLGPIQVLPMPGTQWNPVSMGVNLGRFPAAKGASASVMLFVGAMPEGETFAMESFESSVEGITVSMEPMSGESSNSDEPTKRQRFKMTFSATPGIAPQTRRSADAAKVTVKTNHPEASEVHFQVHFISE